MAVKENAMIELREDQLQVLDGAQQPPVAGSSVPVGGDAFFVQGPSD